MFENVVVGVQSATFLILAVVFAVNHNWRLAVAQCCYVVSTLVVFYR